MPSITHMSFRVKEQPDSGTFCSFLEMITDEKRYQIAQLSENRTILIEAQGWSCFTFYYSSST